MSMKSYKVLKTTMGRKYKVQMSDDEIAERELFYMAITVLPFVTAILLFLVWVKMG